MRPGQAERLAQEVDEQQARLDVDRVRHAVDGDFDIHGLTSPPPGLSSSSSFSPSIVVSPANVFGALLAADGLVRARHVALRARLVLRVGSAGLLEGDGLAAVRALDESGLRGQRMLAELLGQVVAAVRAALQCRQPPAASADARSARSVKADDVALVLDAATEIVLRGSAAPAASRPRRGSPRRRASRR